VLSQSFYSGSDVLRGTVCCHNPLTLDQMWWEARCVVTIPLLWIGCGGRHGVLSQSHYRYSGSGCGERHGVLSQSHYSGSAVVGGTVCCHNPSGRLIELRRGWMQEDIDGGKIILLSLQHFPLCTQSSSIYFSPRLSSSLQIFFFYAGTVYASS
jgi:hypothetical protein